jgi:hypothetical protein
VKSAAMTCPLSTTPGYAYLNATGRSNDGSGLFGGTRVLHATYRLALTNVTDVGGSMSYSTYCWDAGGSPAAGSYVTWQPCLAEGTPRQTWFYRADLSIQWYGDPSANLCLDYSAAWPSSSPSYATLQPCVGDGRYGSAYNPIDHVYPLTGQQTQEFASDGALYEVSSTGDKGSRCLTAYNAAAAAMNSMATGAYVAMATTSACTQGGTTRAQPSTGVGAATAAGVYTGMPGPSEQLVSLAYAARCLDVKGKNPSQGFIDYPCKSTPDMSFIDGNERFQFSGSSSTKGTITSTMSGHYSTVCLDHAGTTVTAITCVSGKTSQQWSFAGATPSQYADAYTIKSDDGLCLEAGNPAVDRTVILATCTGEDDQKWNAPPRHDTSLLAAVGETAPG